MKDGELTLFQCFVGHRFSPQRFGEEHTEALERAHWTTIRKLKGDILHQKLLKQNRDKAEQKLFKRLEESVTTAKNDLKLCAKSWIEFEHGHVCPSH